MESEYFAKQIIYSEFPDHVLQNDVLFVRILRMIFFNT